MVRRLLLCLAALTAFVALAAWRQAAPSAGQLLVLEWANKASGPTPPAAILIEMGLKDTESTDWSGSATVSGAKVVHREGYRFRTEDQLVPPDGWKAQARRPIRVPPRQPA